MGLGLRKIGVGVFEGFAGGLGACQLCREFAVQLSCGRTSHS